MRANHDNLLWKFVAYDFTHDVGAFHRPVERVLHVDVQPYGLSRGKEALNLPLILARDGDDGNGEILSETDDSCVRQVHAILFEACLTADYCKGSSPLQDVQEITSVARYSTASIDLS